MTQRAIDAVLFDYGGVLTVPVRESISAWMRADAVAPSSFTRVLKAWLGREAPAGTPIHRLETGDLDAAGFDALLAAELTTVDGRPIEPTGLLQRIFAEMHPSPGMFELAEDLRDAGIKVGLLSNSWGNTYPRERIDTLFDPVVISGEVGLRKPDADIYELAVARLGLPAGRVLFLDDVEVNVLGARGAGLHAALHTDPLSTRALLGALIPGLTSTPTGAIA